MRVLSYLPLSHVAAQLVDVLCPLKHGWSVFYADPSKVSAQLVDYLTIARP
jgi:long-chain-fatty-acid--CoA ligase ACSBG